MLKALVTFDEGGKKEAPQSKDRLKLAHDAEPLKQAAEAIPFVVWIDYKNCRLSVVRIDQAVILRSL